MILSSKDFIVIGVSLFVVASASTGLYFDYSARIKADRSDKIGTITFKKKTAERKYGNQMIWEDISQESPVYNNDTLRTAEGSAAVVNLGDGTKIDLEENTLVMISLTEKGADIDLAGGSIFAKTSAEAGKAGPLNIRSGGTSVALKGGSLNLTKTADKAVDLNVSSGSAIVSGSGGPVSVGANQSVQVSGGKAEVVKKRYILDSPAPNEYLLLTGAKDLGIQLSWSGSDGKDSTVEVSSDRTLSKAVLKKNGNGTVQGNFPKGDYFWRVSGLNGTSEVRKFTVIEDSVTAPLSPSEGETLSSRMKNPSVLLSWSKSLYASSYLVEFSRVKTFAKIDLSLSSSTNSITTDRLSEGVFFWRVTPHYDFIAAKSASSAFSFTIAKAAEIVPPVLTFPEADSKVGESAASDSSFSFGWVRSAECDSYVIEVSRDKSFNPLIWKQLSSANFISKALPSGEGVYYWRVSGHALDGAVSKPSESRILHVVKNRQPSQLSVQREGSSSYQFKWKDPESMNRYRVEISKDQSYSSIMKNGETTSSFLLFDDIPQGKYWWRVTSLDSRGGAAAVSESSPVSISGELDRPVPEAPVDNVSLDISKMKNLEFSWKAVKDATGYELEIYMYSFAADKLMFKTEASGTKYSLNQFTSLANGNFYWQLTAVRKSGDLIISKSIPAKGYFNIPAGPELKAPKIGNMKVYVE